ncbi:MAG: polyprenyl diphosphate synthase, partial [Pseudomonadota bacterium]|nr:polyprenyl diphosphate synthase [Pseudomonadota bacterium]
MSSASSPSRIPRHLAVIMDGNGRWAERRKRPRIIGHRAGARAVNICIDFCLEHGIEALTLFAFSSENWGRPEDEVGSLMKLFMTALDREVDELHRRDVRIRFIGERDRFSEKIRARMDAAEAQTRANRTLTLTIAASYGGRQDMVLAARALAADVAAGRLRPEQIDEAAVHARMALSDLPAPDLFIRTGGDQRISNFLLW